MTNIDFFGCGFTESTPVDIQYINNKLDFRTFVEYRRAITDFLFYDIAYCNIQNCVINNYGMGSLGNHSIKQVLKNKINFLNKNEKNIAIVQLSALSRPMKDFDDIQRVIFSRKDKLDIFNINYSEVKIDYNKESLSEIEFYYHHLTNIEEIISLIKTNYDAYYIYFGWDVISNQFGTILSLQNFINDINFYPYNFKLNECAFFDNIENYDPATKIISGKFGGKLEYASNKIEEVYRYMGYNDHHPSYFSNKIFYVDLIRPFLNNFLQFEKNFFDEEFIQNFEDKLKIVLERKIKDATWSKYSYDQLTKELKKLINNIV